MLNQKINLFEKFFGSRMIWLMETHGLLVDIEELGSEKVVIDLPTVLRTNKWRQSKSPMFLDIGNKKLLYFGIGEEFYLGVGRVVSKERFLKKYGSVLLSSD